MPAPRNRRHLLVRKPPSSEEYSPHRRKIDLPAIPGPQNRQLHAEALNTALRQVERETRQSRDAVQVSVHGAEPGLYVQFESPPGVELKLESLEDRRSGIELIAVQRLQQPEQLPVQLATVFVPDGKVRYFITRFEQYATEETKKPNPGRRGWKKRHRYASHGLRFGVKSPTESVDDFHKRLNRKALDEDEEKPFSGADSEGWFLGEKARNKGSIHSDEWVGTAADLAERGVIGIYPVSGWWKDQPKRDRSKLGARYALAVSIETEATDVDIWTPVAQQIGVPVEVLVESDEGV